MKKTIYIATLALAFTVACGEQKSKETAAEDTSEVAVEEVKEELSEAEQVAKASASEEFADNPKGHFGKLIEAEGAKTMEEFATLMDGKDSLKVKIQAVATDVCEKKGCWMKIETADGGSMRVKFKDYKFFVPIDITGKKIVFEGIAFKDTTSVEDLKHYAMDGGQSEEEIAAITEPEINTSFLANGVMIPEQ